MTTVILGIDALDHRLVDEFNCSNLKLQNWGELETFAYTNEVPFTLEVWPAIATGKHPREFRKDSSWDNLILELGSHLVKNRSPKLRGKLGAIATSITGQEYTISEIHQETVFDAPSVAVHNWPRVRDSGFLQKQWDLFRFESPVSEAEFDREVYGIGGEVIGWVREMIRCDVPVIATHIHTVDISGHAYFDDKDHYREFYEWLDARVEEIQEQLGDDDDLIIMSDHGMSVAFLENEQEEPGKHSWRACFGTTLDVEPLPETVFDVRAWLERHVDFTEADAGSQTLEVDKEHLRDLGYI